MSGDDPAENACRSTIYAKVEVTKDGSDVED